MKKRIILDVDMGSDDNTCIWLAMLHQKIQVEGITLVHGNTTMQNVKRNVFKTLDMINKNNTVKVYKGASDPLKSYGVTTDDNAHGANGFSGLIYDDVPGTIEDATAVDFLINHVNNNPNKITIVAVGPLTNIAQAILKNQNFAQNIKELVIMGGAENFGNITPYAEFNFYKDPEATRIVFEAGIKKVVMIGFNITKYVTINHEIEKVLITNNDKNAQFLYDISRDTAKIDIEHSGTDGAIINDAVNICYLIDKKILKLDPVCIEIETTDMERLGESKVVPNKPANCYIARGIDTKKCRKIIFNTIFPNLKKQFKNIL